MLSTVKTARKINSHSKSPSKAAVLIEIRRRSIGNLSLPGGAYVLNLSAASPSVFVHALGSSALDTDSSYGTLRRRRPVREAHRAHSHCRGSRKSHCAPVAQAIRLRTAAGMPPPDAHRKHPELTDDRPLRSQSLIETIEVCTRLVDRREVPCQRSKTPLEFPSQVLVRARKNQQIICFDRLGTHRIELHLVVPHHHQQPPRRRFFIQLVQCRPI